MLDLEFAMLELEGVELGKSESGISGFHHLLELLEDGLEPVADGPCHQVGYDVACRLKKKTVI